MSGRTRLTALLARVGTMFSARPAGNDAELLRLGAQFQKLHTILRAQEHTSSISDEQLEAVSDRWWEVLNRARDIPARTLKGLRAKAAMFEPLIIQTVGLDTDDPCHRFALSLARDVLAIGRAVA